MKLLIVTQVVDKDDSILGFFHRWIEEFVAHAERVEVVCLREGRHSLPANVQVHALGEGNKLARALRLVRQCYAARKAYDRVFVHMNPEYLIAAGWLWRLLGKRVALWYTHKSVNYRLRLGAPFADIIFTASKESFRLKSEKVRVMGHGIDTEFFSPGTEPRSDTVLTAGRLSPAKRNDLVLRAGQYFHRHIWIAGEGPELANLQGLAATLQLAERTQFLGARTHEQMRELYRRCGVLAHASETGSIDKVVLEALLCGLPVVSTSEAFKEMLEPHGLFASAEPKALAAALERAQGANISALTDLVRREHALERLIPSLIAGLR